MPSVGLSVVSLAIPTMQKGDRLAAYVVRLRIAVAEALNRCLARETVRVGSGR